MFPMYLEYFTKDKTFPFFIQYGEHENGIFSHKHNNFSELVIVLSGSAVHVVNDEEYLVKKGDVFVMREGTSHSYKDTVDFHICNIMYQQEHLVAKDSDIRTSPGYHALFMIEPAMTKQHGFQSRLSLKLSDFEKIERMTQMMLVEYDQKEAGWKTVMLGYFTVLTVQLSRLYQLKEKEEEKGAISITRSIAYMERHFTETLLIPELAEMAGVSTRHFTRLFEETYHTTPLKYINILRMQHASVLLRSTRMTITEVAQLSGFSDSNYFSRQFRKAFHQSPREYRTGIAGNKYV